ncbi:Uncharacterized protein FWK35_00011040 [Aphis craccivora]|uniref:Transposable element P transposase-like GTP-binding insertion domain-containing protein n=1 Tax=Aphis craccivora TaxID=307492 RepID=A0A6G0YBN3_APHCR|nr:Uncharacterized protein FWK35_00011040 [Aphis craccivora]
MFTHQKFRKNVSNQKLLFFLYYVVQHYAYYILKKFANTTVCKYLGANFGIIESSFQRTSFYFLRCMSRLLFNDKHEEVNWDYIKNVYNKENNESLKVATKLSSRHIFYFNEKMNVMSNSVSNVLKCCDLLGDSSFKGNEGTANAKYLKRLSTKNYFHGFINY